jgi:ABC-type dipeptide/oligopeptide/nickel transport system permease component
VFAYVVRRLGLSVVIVAGVSFFVFLMIHLVPGDPVLVMLAESPSVEDRATLERELGLDEPLYEQYWDYVSRAVHGDLGYSIRLQVPVTELIRDRLPNTLVLTIAALGLAVLFGIVLGTISAVYHRTPGDYAVMFGALVGVSIPSFFLGIMLLLFFGLKLGWLPIAGNTDGVKSLVLPAITLAVVPLAVIARLTRSSLLNALGEDYIRVARAKGLARRKVVLRHGLRNSLIPVVTVVGVQFGTLMAGAVIVESVFAWPGIGRLLVNAVNDRDFPLVQGIVLVVAVGFVLVNLLVDVLYPLIDPRVRHG